MFPSPLTRLRSRTKQKQIADKVILVAPQTPIRIRLRCHEGVVMKQAVKDRIVKPTPVLFGKHINVTDEHGESLSYQPTKPYNRPQVYHVKQGDRVDCVSKCNKSNPD